MSGLPSLSSYSNKNPSTSTGHYVNHYVSADPFKASASKQAQYAANVAKAQAQSKASQHHSVWDSIANVVGNGLGEAKDMAVGFGPGLVHAVEHPIATGEAIGQDYKTRYSKILHGDFSDLSKHPLSYILDAATVASLGAGGLVRAAKVADLAAPESAVAKSLTKLTSPRSAEIGFTKKTGGIQTHLSGNPYKRFKEQTLLKAQKTVIPTKTPIVGLKAKATRTLVNQQRDYEAAVRSTQKLYSHKVKGFNPTQMTVLDALVRGIRPRDELHFLQTLHGEKIHGETYTRLNSAAADKLFKETVAARKGLGPVTKGARKMIDAYHAHEKLAAENTAVLAKLKKLSPEASQARTILHHVVMRQIMGQHLPFSNGGVDAQALAREVEHQTGFKPLYTPDNMLLAHTNSATAKNQAALFRAGVRDPHTGHLLGRHEATSRMLAAEAARERLRAAAVHVDPKRKLPDGYSWLNEHVNSKDFIERHIPQFEAEGEALRAKNAGAARAAFEQAVLQEARPSHNLAVPEGAVADIANRRIRSHGTITSGLERHTALWKKSVLAFRPAFVVGNYTGNQILYHLHNGLGVRGLASALKERRALETQFGEHGHDYTFGATEMLHDKKLSSRAANAFYRLVATHETALRTSTMVEAAHKIPEFKSALRKLRSDLASGKRTLPRDTTVFHQALQDAIKKNPEVRQEISHVIDDTMGNYRYYNQFESNLKQLVPFYGWNRHALRSYYRLLQDHPAVADMVYHLGEMGKQENAKEFPGVPSFMASYIKAPGALKALGNVIDTRGLNPLSTAADDIRAVEQLTHGKVGQMDAVVSNLNPVVAQAINTIVGKNIATGAPLPKQFLDSGVGRIPVSVAESTPEWMIASHLLGTDKPNPNDIHQQFTPTGRPKKPTQHMLAHTTDQLLANFLGLPSKNLNIKVAQTVQKKLATQANPGFHVANPPRRKKTSNSFFVK